MYNFVQFLSESQQLFQSVPSLLSNLSTVIFNVNKYTVPQESTSSKCSVLNNVIITKIVSWDGFSHHLVALFTQVNLNYIYCRMKISTDKCSRNIYKDSQFNENTISGISGIYNNEDCPWRIMKLRFIYNKCDKNVWVGNQMIIPKKLLYAIEIKFCFIVFVGIVWNHCLQYWYQLKYNIDATFDNFNNYNWNFDDWYGINIHLPYFNLLLIILEDNNFSE